MSEKLIKGIKKEEDLESISDDEEEHFPEGRILYRIHKKRERNNNVVKEKKKQAMQKGQLKCEVCEFDFFLNYGEIGKGFMECHHITPVSEYDLDKKTTLKDLVLVCANCHRMLHRKRPWISSEELKELLQKRES